MKTLMLVVMIISSFSLFAGAELGQQSQTQCVYSTNASRKKVDKRKIKQKRKQKRVKRASSL